jgi:hypothetical protein
VVVPFDKFNSFEAFILFLVPQGRRSQAQYIFLNSLGVTCSAAGTPAAGAIPVFILSKPLKKKKEKNLVHIRFFYSKK